MKTRLTLLIIIIALLNVTAIFSQSDSRHDNTSGTGSNLTMKPKRELNNSFGLNLLFSDNGFGLGATFYKQLSTNVSGFAGIIVSGAKDSREFEQVDIFGNSNTPYKVNRLFMVPLNLGLQFRMFRNDVTDNMRPFVNFGISPTAIIYTPYDKSFFSAWGYARAKYTVGGFVGLGMDYVTNHSSSLEMNIRYYYINLFGEGVNSISTSDKKFFGGLFFNFSYNFMH